MSSCMICIEIGLMEIKYIETPNGEWLDDYDDLVAFDFDAVFGSGERLNQVENSIELAFDGDLDNPFIYRRITAIGVTGPKYLVENSILCLSDTQFYFKVESTEELDVDDLEDLLHLIEPTIEIEGYTIAYGDFSDWEINFVDEPSIRRQLRIEWVPN